MRTTVTLDADVQAMLNRAMRERGGSFKETLNSAIRSGLAGNSGSAPQTPFSLKTFSMGFHPERNLDKALALASAMEDDAIARKMSVRK